MISGHRAALGGDLLARPALRLSRAAVWLLGLIVLAVLVWQAVTAQGAPNPASPHLGGFAAVVDTGVLVFREGLEAILVLAAVTASLVKRHQGFWTPVALGAGAGFLASVATWFIVVAVLSSISLPELDIQAGTGLLAILVLLLVMNWFFHRVYWTGWISLHTQKRNAIMAGEPGGAKVVWGLALLGFTSVYREGFEVVLFLQSLRMQVGEGTVLTGSAIGVVLALMVAFLTFRLHWRLPYKRMLVLTGVMLGAVLLVMVGESVQEMQLAGWLPATWIAGWRWPGWLNVWFALFPTVQSLAAQGAAAAAVLGSYVVSEYAQVWRPRRLASRHQRSVT